MLQDSPSSTSYTGTSSPSAPSSSTDWQPHHISTTTALRRIPGLILIPDTPKGRGVFTTQPIPAKTVVDVCPVLVLDRRDVDDHIRYTLLHHYTYNWPAASKAKEKTKTDIDSTDSTTHTSTVPSTNSSA